MKLLCRDTLLSLYALLTIVMGDFFPTMGEVGISFRDNRTNVLAMRWAMRQITYISHVWYQWEYLFAWQHVAVITILMKHILLWCFYFSHQPNGLCRLGDDKCEEISGEVNYNIFVISSNTRCAGTQCLQLHDILPLHLRQEGIHNDGRPCCIWCIRGHSCTGSHFLAYAQVKLEVVGWIYHLAGQQQFGFSSYCVNINL